MRTLRQVTVPGHAQPQGSTRAFVRGGRAIVTSANPKLADWRARVAGALWVAAPPATGAVVVQLAFDLARPKSVRRTHATTRPDLDKLVRAMLDAGTEAGVWRDDAQVVEVVATKQYTSLAPCVRMTVLALDGDA
jgi:Holliday junction resolvase RusA-like endonuclease